eukprot:TRINITY_DN63398_c0_g1_i2.p1 TRINITY_DN63398_c0_g1~~TRINITY_DN63398_c0_g1_i2.p1  ORF type:complete len:374 (+),score=28.56 TRINITY_DN63398_c0_g1_i2:88-1209(+)
MNILQNPLDDTVWLHKSDTVEAEGPLSVVDSAYVTIPHFTRHDNDALHPHTLRAHGKVFQAEKFNRWKGKVREPGVPKYYNSVYEEVLAQREMEMEKRRLGRAWSPPRFPDKDFGTKKKPRRKKRDHFDDNYSRSSGLRTARTPPPRAMQPPHQSSFSSRGGRHNYTHDGYYQADMNDEEDREYYMYPTTATSRSNSHFGSISNTHHNVQRHRTKQGSRGRPHRDMSPAHSHARHHGQDPHYQEDSGWYSSSGSSGGRASPSSAPSQRTWIDPSTPNIGRKDPPPPASPTYQLKRPSNGSHSHSHSHSQQAHHFTNPREPNSPRQTSPMNRWEQSPRRLDFELPHDHQLVQDIFDGDVTAAELPLPPLFLLVP